MIVDISKKMYLDSKGKDPDTYGKVLHEYHNLLWNKKLLPNGEILFFESSKTSPYYFHTIMSIKNITRLSSDSIIHTYSRTSWDIMNSFLEEIDKNQIKEFYDLGNTIGGYIIFPSNKIDNKFTINQARGIHQEIKDRFDLTLECIRLWYLNKGSPLYDHIERYRNFFELFVDFKGYIDFFLLNDLVDEKYEHIKFWLPFEGFFEKRSPLPLNKSEYLDYMNKVSQFVILRNNRIAKEEKS